MTRIDERTVNTVRGVLLAVGLVLSVGMTVPDVGLGEQELVDSSESATSSLSPVPLTGERGVGYVPDRPAFERIGDASADVVQNAGLAAPQHDGYVEEVIVTADRLEKGARPTQTIIVQTYSVLRRGKRLYNERRYKEALPYLLIAGKRGFKWAQAMAGDIYLQGRGGVARDIEAGMGWLGVAARPQTAPRIQTYFRRALAEMSPRQREHVDLVVARYREEWSSGDWRVSCRRAVSSSPAALGVLSLRLNKRMYCTFMDETPVCRLPLGADLSGVMNPVSAPFQWVCPPVSG